MCAKRNFEPVQKRFWSILAKKRGGFTNFSALGDKMGKVNFARFDKRVHTNSKKLVWIFFNFFDNWEFSQN